MKSDIRSPWTLRGTSAAFSTAEWSGKIDLEDPARGLELSCGSTEPTSGFLGVDFAPPCRPFEKDCYVRQGDLISAYPQRDNRKFSLQLDYRLLEATADRLLIELWISIQTYLLDSRPTVTVSCRADDDSGRTQGLDNDRTNRAVIEGSIGRALHWAWLIHPRDQGDTSWQWKADQHVYEADLFGHFMEKGVIRRARMRCLIGTTELTPLEINEAYQTFAASPLPLTA